MGDLKKVVKELIALKKEGDYWDFKLKAYTKDKNQDFVHDILCLANSAHKGNRYLILGVCDKTFEIIGVEEDSKRKRQEGYISILRECGFAGDYRPEITLHSLEISIHTVEVIEILDLPSKPYYLTIRYKDVKPYHIYTRIGDRNTPIDKSADLIKVEKMWRQRFGIDEIPLDRLKKLFLEPGNWIKDIGNKYYGYHKFFPEFNYRYKKSHKNEDSFKYFFDDDFYIPYVGEIKFYYHSTLLKEFEILLFDGFRKYLPVPSISSLSMDSDFNFYYYQKDNFHGHLLYFMQNEYIIKDRHSKILPIPIFDNEEIRDRFIRSVTKTDLQKYNSSISKYFSDDKLKKADECSGALLKNTILMFLHHKSFKLGL